MMLKYYMALPCFSDVPQIVRNRKYFFKTLFKKMFFFLFFFFFRTAPGTDDDVATTTCILSFFCHLFFISVHTFKNK